MAMSSPLGIFWKLGLLTAVYFLLYGLLAVTGITPSLLLTIGGANSALEAGDYFDFWFCFLGLTTFLTLGDVSSAKLRIDGVFESDCAVFTFFVGKDVSFGFGPAGLATFTFEEG